MGDDHRALLDGHRLDGLHRHREVRLHQERVAVHRRHRQVGHHQYVGGYSHRCGYRRRGVLPQQDRRGGPEAVESACQKPNAAAQGAAESAYQ